MGRAMGGPTYVLLRRQLLFLCPHYQFSTTCHFYHNSKLKLQYQMLSNECHKSANEKYVVWSCGWILLFWFGKLKLIEISYNKSIYIFISFSWMPYATICMCYIFGGKGWVYLYPVNISTLPSLFTPRWPKKKFGVKKMWRKKNGGFYYSELNWIHISFTPTWRKKRESRNLLNSKILA